MIALVVALALHACAPRIDVSVPTPRSTTATLAVSACSKRLLGPWPARVGRNGVSSRHREGDGTTPLGTFGIGPVVYGIDPNPGVRLRYHRLVCGDWWDEDPRSPAYNRFRHVACGKRPSFAGASEALWQITPAYRLFAFIRYNVAPAAPGRGSAIFLHVDTGHATNGCVSLPRPELVRVLRLLGPGATITIRSG
ncbi:MAG: L,D-transpeptidase [Gaiellaceae bacterium]